MFEHRSRDATVQDTNPLTPEEALRKARIALSRLIKRYQYGLERMPSSKIRDQSSLALVDTQIDGARYVLVKAPLALSRSLTDRQLEVALFAAEGLSNKEVGGRLSITTATVAAHLSRFDWEGLDINEWENVKRWYLNVAKRPAVISGWNIPENDQLMPMPS